MQGRVAAGSLPAYLPTVLGFSAAGARQYQLLSALRELIATAGDSPELEAAALPALLGRADDPDKSVRAAVAECLGQLPAARVLPALLALVPAEGALPSPALLYTAAAATRHLQARVAGDGSAEALVTLVGRLLLCEDLGAREEVLRLLLAALSRPDRLLTDSPAVAARVLDSLAFKHIVEVDLGPFKQKNDLGLPLRRLALDCADLLLLRGSAALDPAALLGLLPALLRDDDGVKLHAHKLLGRLCRDGRTSAAVGAAVDTLVEPLSKTVLTKPPEGKKGPDLERLLEVVRSAVRAVHCVAALPEAAACAKWTEFVARARSDPRVAEYLLAADTADGQ